MPPCRPHATMDSADPNSACHMVILCVRCGCCLLHCSCIPEDLRAKNPDALARQVHIDFARRKVPKPRPANP
jgi:hypothetical protein